MSDDRGSRKSGSPISAHSKSPMPPGTDGGENTENQETAGKYAVNCKAKIASRSNEK